LCMLPSPESLGNAISQWHLQAHLLFDLSKNIYPCCFYLIKQQHAQIVPFASLQALFAFIPWESARNPKPETLNPKP
jgi:hypothetical protein